MRGKCHADSFEVAGADTNLANWDGWRVITASRVVTVRCYDLICVICQFIVLYSVGQTIWGKITVRTATYTTIPNTNIMFFVSGRGASTPPAPTEAPTDASVEDAFAEDTGHFQKTHQDLFWDQRNFVAD